MSAGLPALCTGMANLSYAKTSAHSVVAFPSRLGTCPRDAYAPQRGQALGRTVPTRGGSLLELKLATRHRWQAHQSSGRLQPDPIPLSGRPTSHLRQQPNDARYADAAGGHGVRGAPCSTIYCRPLRSIVLSSWMRVRADMDRAARLTTGRPFNVDRSRSRYGYCQSELRRVTWLGGPPGDACAHLE
jgi:hypothetical protein